MPPCYNFIWPAVGYIYIFISWRTPTGKKMCFSLFFGLWLFGLMFGAPIRNEWAWVYYFNSKSLPRRLYKLHLSCIFSSLGLKAQSTRTKNAKKRKICRRKHFVSKLKSRIFTRSPRAPFVLFPCALWGFIPTFLPCDLTWKKKKPKRNSRKKMARKSRNMAMKS